MTNNFPPIDKTLRQKITINTILLSGAMTPLYAMAQLVLAMAAITFATISGSKALAGFGPAIYIFASSFAGLAAGKLMDRVGRIPVLLIGFGIGALGALVTAFGVGRFSLSWLIIGLVLFGIAIGVGSLTRVAAADMYRPEKRAWSIAVVMFGAVFGAILGPLIFSPLFKNIGATLPVAPWYMAGGFMVLGLLLIAFVRPDPQKIATMISPKKSNLAGGIDETAGAPLAEILRRPGVITALFVIFISNAVMTALMSMTGLLMIQQGYPQQNIFPVFTIHMLGMFALMLPVGKFIEKVGRPPAMITGLVLLTLSVLAMLLIENSMVWSMIALFGLGLGWSISFIAANAELANITTARERGGLMGFSDLLVGLSGAALTLLSGLIMAKIGFTSLSIIAAVLALTPIWSVIRRKKI